MSDKAARSYKWQEIAKHNTDQSAWVYLNNDVYDVTSFIERHPGGRDLILLMAGRDITDVFDSYHPFTDKPRAVLKQFKIGTLDGPPEFGRFKPDSGFYKECRSEVAKYFKTNNLDSKSMFAGIWRYALIMAVLLTCWFNAWSQRDTLPFIARLALMIIAGAFQGMLLIHTMHDCSHAAFGHIPGVWKWLGRMCLDVTCGCSFDAWLHQHVVGHHVYTNVIEIDPDCPMQRTGDVRRLMPSQEWSRRYRLQWLYLPAVYCVYAFKNRVQDVTQTLLGGFNGAMRVNPEFSNTESRVRQALCKGLWVARAMVYPMIYNSWATEFLPLFLAMELSTGYFLTFNFQVSHVSPCVEWPQPNEEGVIDGEWAQLQVKTSCDYGHASWLCTFWSGALNYQSVHHLFPCVSQYHYPAIAPIIRKVCDKYDVHFNHIDSFGEAFAAHIHQLYDMGLAPDEYAAMKSKRKEE